MASLATEERRGLRTLITIAALVIVIWGLRWAGPVLLPILAAGFLAVLSIPPMRRLERHGCPRWVALIIVVTVATIAVILVAALVGSSILQFQGQLDFYRERLNEIVGAGVGWLAGLGLDVSTDDILNKLDTGKIMELVANTLSGMIAATGNLLLVVLTMVFMLLEANALPEKIRAARRLAGKEDSDDLSEFSAAAKKINEYLAIKAVVSGATGIAAVVLTWAIGVDFPLLWGLLAFLFNFVPNIGSIIAAIPAVLLALIQLGPGPALGVAAGYTAINLVLGNAVEPKLMGERLGLSTLVVFVSLIFWEWVWGPLGMLLSVPLTVIVKILLEHSADLRPLALMLGPSPSPEREPEREPAP